MLRIAEHASVLRMPVERLLGYCWACGIDGKAGDSDLSPHELQRLDTYIAMHPNFEPPSSAPTNGYQGRFFLVRERGRPRSIFILALFQSDEDPPEIIGHCRDKVEPGDNFAGYSFDELWRLGDGPYALHPHYKHE